jgi:UDP-N-acetylmuramate dehydrogenase
LQTVLEQPKQKINSSLAAEQRSFWQRHWHTLVVIHIDLKGKKIMMKRWDFVWVKVTLENWHEFVLWTIDQNFGGLENMSLIPGNVGTSVKA